jgi:hypothetical protein
MRSPLRVRSSEVPVPSRRRALHESHVQTHLHSLHRRIPVICGICAPRDWCHSPDCGTSSPMGELFYPNNHNNPFHSVQLNKVALVLAGKRVLPMQNDMNSIIEFDSRNHNFTQDGERPSLVNWIQYMDQVANLIGRYLIACAC